MNIEEYRKRIDELDSEIIEKLEERFGIAVKIGELKKGSGLPILDAEREWKKLESIEAKSNPEYAEYVLDVFEAIILASRTIQEEN